MRTARRLTAAAILGVVTLVSLAGCVKVDVALSVHDDVVDGTMLIGADKRLADLSGQSRETVLASITQNAPSGPGVTSQRFEDTTYIGMRFTLTNVPIANLNQDRTGLVLTHDTDSGTYVVSGTLDLGALNPEGFATAGLASSFDVRFAVTFPGSVTRHNGQLDGTTVTWVATPGQTLLVDAVAKDGDPVPWLLVLAIGIPAVLIIGGLAFWLMGRRPKAGASRANEPPAESATLAEPTTVAKSATPAEPTGASQTDPPPTGDPVTRQEAGQAQS
jgi:hypothetical protein